MDAEPGSGTAVELNNRLPIPKALLAAPVTVSVTEVNPDKSSKPANWGIREEEYATTPLLSVILKLPVFEISLMPNSTIGVLKVKVIVL